jgi:hypothetical protein
MPYSKEKKTVFANITIHKDSQRLATVAFAHFSVKRAFEKSVSPAHYVMVGDAMKI